MEFYLHDPFLSLKLWGFFSFLSVTMFFYYPLLFVTILLLHFFTLNILCSKVSIITN